MYKSYLAIIVKCWKQPNSLSTVDCIKHGMGCICVCTSIMAICKYIYIHLTNIILIQRPDIKTHILFDSIHVMFKKDQLLSDVRSQDIDCLWEERGVLIGRKYKGGFSNFISRSVWWVHRHFYCTHLYTTCYIYVHIHANVNNYIFVKEKVLKIKQKSGIWKVSKHKS